MKRAPWVPTLPPALPIEGRTSRVPDGKSVLNIQLAANEHAWLRDRARREGLSVTMLVRLLIREAMK